MLKVALDSMPQTRDSAECRDHSATQVFSLTHAPLFAHDPRGALPACATAIESVDGLSHRIRLAAAAPDADVYRRVLERCRGTPRPESFWLRQLHSVDSGDREIILRTRRPHHRLDEVLSMLSLAPDGGRYAIDTWSRSAIALAPNPTWQGPDTRGNVALLRVKSPEDNVNLFSDGALDVTSDTAFPLDLVCRRLEDPCLRVLPTGIFATLCFADTLPRALRERIFAAISQEDLARRLAGVYRPANDFCPELSPHTRIVQSAHSEIDAPEGRGTSGLRLVYDDYYPNDLLCQIVACQLRAAGFDVELVPDSYEAPTQTGDLRLRLEKGLRSGPLSLYHAFLFHPLLRADRDAAVAYLELLDADETSLVRDPQIAAGLHRVLTDLALVVPLVEIPGVFLSRRPQTPWEWSA